MLFEVIIQSFLSIFAIYYAVVLLRSFKYWKMILGIILMAAGILFALTAGEILMWVMGYVPDSGHVKILLAPYFPYAVLASFIAWLGYIILAYYSRLQIIGTLWSAYQTKTVKVSDHLEAAKNNALKDQFLWLIVSFIVTLTALAISILSWTYQAMVYEQMEIMVIAIVWVFVFPPLVIHTGLKKTHEILALKKLKDFGSIESEKVSGYRELIAVMDDIKDEELKKQLDEMIINGLTKNLIEHRISSEKK